MRVWLTRDERESHEICVWPEKYKPRYMGDNLEGEWENESYIGPLGFLPPEMIADTLPENVRRGGPKAIALKELLFMDCAG